MSMHRRTIAMGMSLIASGTCLASNDDIVIARDASLDLVARFSGGDASLAQEIARRDGIVFDGWADGHEYLVYWQETGIGVVEDRGHPLIDVITVADRAGYSFAGGWSEGVPALTGKVSLAPDEGLELRLQRAGDQTIRINVDRAGKSRAEKCVCWGTATPKGSCSDEDCDNAKACHVKKSDAGSLYCSWRELPKLVIAPAEGWMLLPE